MVLEEVETANQTPVKPQPETTNSLVCDENVRSFKNILFKGDRDNSDDDNFLQRKKSLQRKESTLTSVSISSKSNDAWKSNTGNPRRF